MSVCTISIQYRINTFLKCQFEKSDLRLSLLAKVYVPGSFSETMPK